MPNMEYCAFENTVRALDQILDILEEALEEDSPSLGEFKATRSSHHESSAVVQLFEKCLEIVNLTVDVGWATGESADISYDN